MQRLFVVRFPYFNAVGNKRQLKLTAILIIKIMFSRFLAYLNSVPCSILLCKLYFSPMRRLYIFYDFSMRSKLSFQKLSKLYV